MPEKSQNNFNYASKAPYKYFNFFNYIDLFLNDNVLIRSNSGTNVNNLLPVLAYTTD